MDTRERETEAVRKYDVVRVSESYEGPEAGTIGFYMGLEGKTGLALIVHPFSGKHLIPFASIKPVPKKEARTP